MSKVRYLWLKRVSFGAIRREIEAAEYARLRRLIDAALQRVAAARERAKQKRRAHLRTIK